MFVQQVAAAAHHLPTSVEIFCFSCVHRHQRDTFINNTFDIFANYGKLIVYMFCILCSYLRFVSYVLGLVLTVRLVYFEIIIWDIYFCFSTDSALQRELLVICRSVIVQQISCEPVNLCKECSDHISVSLIRVCLLSLCQQLPGEIQHQQT